MILPFAALGIRTLNSLDYCILIAYFLFNIAIGLWIVRKNKTENKTSSDQFLRGAGKTAWWAAGISWFATGQSSISVMAIPATTYSKNWLSFGSTPAQSIATVLIAFVFVSLLRKLNITTLFEYLESRFSRKVRVLGAILTLLLKILGRISVVLLLPSLALSQVTGLNVYGSIILIGGVTIAYAIGGGFEAVIWTDVAQSIILFGGLFFVMYQIIHGVPHGLSGIFAVAESHQKLQATSWALDLNEPTIWVFIGMSLGSIFQQVGDQPLMQRVFSTPDVKSARNSVLLGAVLSIPAALFFFFLGTALWAFYQVHPDHLNSLPTSDAIVPYFIVNELPHGLIGLIVAGIFASSMGTISSVINSTATIAKIDCFDLLYPNKSDKAQVSFARWATFAAGLLAMIMALYIASLNVQSLWDQYLQLLALIGGGLPGVFALGLLTRKANSNGVLIGLLVSILITWAVQHYTHISSFLHGFVAIASTIVIGYVASLLIPTKDKSHLKGLTVWDRNV
jgi:SSS family transporter